MYKSIEYFHMSKIYKNDLEPPWTLICHIQSDSFNSVLRKLDQGGLILENLIGSFDYQFLNVYSRLYLIL